MSGTGLQNQYSRIRTLRAADQANESPTWIYQLRPMLDIDRLLIFVYIVWINGDSNTTAGLSWLQALLSSFFLSSNCAVKPE